MESVGNEIRLVYTSPDLAVDLTYQLTGGATGKDSAGLVENVTLRNLGHTALSLAWFMEADFDVGGFGGQDVAFGDVSGITQTDGAFTVRVTSSLTPNTFEIASFPDLFLSLSDLSTTDLVNGGSPLGPGDASFAYQWSLTIPADDAVTFSLDKNFIPEPDSFALCTLLLGLLAVGQLRSRSAGRSPDQLRN